MSESLRRIAFVVNPISGTQSKHQALSFIRENLKEEDGFLVEIIRTEYAGHANEIAKTKASEGFDTVVAVGGDGTINEVASALVGTSTALGIVPFGSGNGLARHLQLPMNHKNAIRVIMEGLRETIDYGTINDQPFFCTCGCGFDAFVSLKFAENGKRGPLTYVDESLRETLNYEPETYEITVDGETTAKKAFVIACGNAAQYGNNAFIAPHAELNDGLLDVTIVKPFTALDIPELSVKLFTKAIDQNSHIETFKCKSLHIHRMQPGVVHYDGDPVEMGQDLDVRLHQGELIVIVPSERMRVPDPVTRAQNVVNGWKQLNERIFDGRIIEDINERRQLLNKRLIQLRKTGVNLLMKEKDPENLQKPE